MQFTFCPLLFVNPAFVREGPGFTILAINNHPESRGSVSLRSPSPFDKNNSQFEPTFGKRAIRYPEPSGRAKAIAKAYEALPTGGALIVYEALIDDDRSQNAFGLLISLNMLIETSGGFDYTGADCSLWMRESTAA